MVGARDLKTALALALPDTCSRIKTRGSCLRRSGIRHKSCSTVASVLITGEGGVIGFAIVHSKLIVVDPFTDPVVVTGSHNFSSAASQKNDENSVIVRGNGELARHYAAHILSVYHHYRWLAFVHELQGAGKSPDGYLKTSDLWQDSQLKGVAKRELDFWLR